MGVIAFYLFGGLLLLFSLLVILSRHPAYAVLYLLGAMFSLSALYVLLGAFFVAALQIVLYAGAVLVMFLFVVMLLSLKEDVEAGGRKWARVAGSIVGLLFFASIFSAVRGVGGSGSAISMEGMVGGVREVGVQLFTTYLFPFEVTSLIILAALVGAIVIGKAGVKENG